MQCRAPPRGSARVGRRFAAYEPAKAMWLGRGGQGPDAKLTALASFILGAYSRAVSDSVTCALPAGAQAGAQGTQG